MEAPFQRDILAINRADLALPRFTRTYNSMLVPSFRVPLLDLPESIGECPRDQLPHRSFVAVTTLAPVANRYLPTVIGVTRRFAPPVATAARYGHSGNEKIKHVTLSGSSTIDCMFKLSAS